MIFEAVRLPLRATLAATVAVGRVRLYGLQAVAVLVTFCIELGARFRARSTFPNESLGLNLLHRGRSGTSHRAKGHPPLYSTRF